MRIAIINGGSKCLELMQTIEWLPFDGEVPRIVAVADHNVNSPCMVRARAKGLFTTNHFSNLLTRNDVDLIVDLTGDPNLRRDIIDQKPRAIRYIDAVTYQMFVQMFRDIGRVRDIKKMPKQSQMMCEIMLNDLIKENVMVIASDYRILNVNETMREKLGLKRKEIIGRFCYEITHHRKTPCSGENHPCPLAMTLETWEPSQTTHVHMDKDNKSSYYSISTYPLIENGKVVGAIEMSRNITPDLDRQKQLMEQDKLISIGRLSAGVAHEINNPLTTILTTAMLIQEDMDPDDEIYEELGTIVNETLRCRKIVTSLLDYARQNKPKKALQQMNSLITETVLLTQKQAAFHDIALESRLAEDLPLIWIDKGQIQQVLINMILNAIEATDAGGKVQVTSGLDPENQCVLVTVQDTGCGIPDQLLTTIFDPFFTTKETGTGLGLSISQGIVKQHGGEIQVKSDDTGTTFTIRLPLNQTEQSIDESD